MGIEHLIQQGLNDLLGGILGAQHPAETGPGARPASDGGWDASVGGGSPQRDFDRGLAHVAGAAYDPSRGEAAGWRRLGDGELAQAGINAGLQYRDGMLAGVYTDGNGHYTVAYAGNTGEDVPTVLAQSAGVDTRQINHAVDLAHQVENAFGGDNVIYTGHSMGGALAGAAAAATDSTSVVFNAQGVHDNTLARLGLDPGATRAAMAQSSRAYGLDGDWATMVQNDIPFLNALPDALGADLRLANPAAGSLDAHRPGPLLDAFDSGMAIRPGDSQSQPFEQQAQDVLNFLTGFLRSLPIRI